VAALRAAAVIRVLLADDESLIRAGLRLLLESQPDLEIIGEATDGAEALGLARERGPDIILMDIGMPGVDGIEATREIAADEQLSGAHVLILTTYETDERIFDALRAGASGFLLKDSDPDELLRAIRVVVAGDALLAPSVTRRVIAEVTSRSDVGLMKPEKLRWLTDREREVVSLVALGLSNEEIAARLVISMATAKTHVGRSMRKLGAHDRAQLVVFAYESGLVVPGARPDGAALAR
jgi:DNA-binding NarL/FixJ family response regulator